MSNPILDAMSLISDPSRKFEVVNKFGRSDNIGTSFAPVAIGEIYNTPQPAAATTLRIKAGGNANDTAAGSGARKVKIYGLNATGELVEEELTTAGESASDVSTNSYIRVFRAYVSESGTYATQSAGSHSAAITIENGAGGTNWATIDATDFPRSQSEIGSYTVPLGKSAVLMMQDINVDSNKSADILLFQRQSILDTAAPYQSMRVIQEFKAVQGNVNISTPIPLGPYPELTDIGYMAKVGAGTAEVEVSFQILLYDPEGLDHWIGVDL